MSDAHTDNRRLRAEAQRLREKVDRLEAEAVKLKVVASYQQTVIERLLLEAEIWRGAA